MHALNISWADIAVVGIVIVSTILAVARGFVREILSILAWAAAAAATLYFGPPLAAYLGARISTPLLGPAIAYAGIFLVVLIPLSFVSYRLSERVRKSPVGTLDRSLGVPFGIVRGLALIGIAYLAISLVIPVRAQPDWLSRARSLALMQRSSDVILSFVPSHRDIALPAASAGKSASHHSTINPGRKTYQADDRRALDRLIQASGSSGGDKR